MNDHDPQDDELVARITRALHSRDAAQPDPALVAARIRAELAHAPEATVTTLARRGGRLVAAGLVTSTLAVAGAGAAAAANPYSDVARRFETVVQAVGIEWSAMPDGYTREQYEAFWGAGYTSQDVVLLEELWHTGTTETKARAGQLLLDGQTPPVAPGTVAELPEYLDQTQTQTQTEFDAFWDAGYTAEDAAELAQLWNVDELESKARVGRMLLAGETPPITPGG